MFNPCGNLLLRWASGAFILASAASTPVPQYADLFRGARAAHIQPGPPTDRTLDVAALPELWQSARFSGPTAEARLRTLAAGARLGAQWEAAGLGEVAAHGSGSLHRLKNTKSKTNTQQMKPPHPQGFAQRPSRGPCRRPPAWLLGSQTQSPRVNGAGVGVGGGGTSEEFVSRIPSSLASF